MEEPLILHLECAVQGAISAAISRGLTLLVKEKLTGEASASSALIPLAQNLLKTSAIEATELNAIAVSAGPGSFTGIRIGIASAKGMAYALGIPLIYVPTLHIMAEEAIQKKQHKLPIVALMDARRMEVFAAVYTPEGQDLVKPSPMVAGNKHPVQDFMDGKDPFYLVGDGVAKWKDAHLTGKGLSTDLTTPDAAFMVRYAKNSFHNRQFAGTYDEPFYLKEGNAKSV